ncbi:MAG: hypothetical protein JSV18_06335 [Candidatus Bathyarchaeota archaeon]|nr:MAG: hypothetical protein JSV18_06335 [Candidatus Bathyarchaeota archaeon]
MGDINPHNVCTWGDREDCATCSLHGRLNCRWEAGKLARFAAIALPFMTVSALGVILTWTQTGNWGFPAAYLILLTLFFTLVEARILCRHCPFYARSGRTIRCHANHGLPKAWSYDPKPLNGYERYGLLLCFSFLGFFPIIAEAYGYWHSIANPSFQGANQYLVWAGIILVNLVMLISFFYLLRRLSCPHCVNFSCPLNRTPIALREEYLKRNTVMKDAWDGTGAPPSLD